jgi:hypothetical protein
MIYAGRVCAGIGGNCSVLSRFPFFQDQYRRADTFFGWVRK